MMVLKEQSQHKMAAPHSLFPCALGVTMPQFGAKESGVSREPHKAFSRQLEALNPIRRSSAALDESYVKGISEGIKFEEDVVKERCFYMLPYDSKYLQEALDVGDLIKPRPTIHPPNHGQLNVTGNNIRHFHCSIVPPKPRLKPLKKDAAKKSRPKSIPGPAATQPPEEEKKDKIEKIPGDKQAKQTVVFLTEAQQNLKPDNMQSLEEKLKAVRAEAAADAEEFKHNKTVFARAERLKRKKDWDHYLISRLSEKTATWMVYECTPASKQREQLQKSLVSWYGKPQCIDLVMDKGNVAESSLDELPALKKKVKPKKPWKKDNAYLLEKVYGTSTGVPEALDPYSDDNQAPFYRQPQGIRKIKKQKEEEVEVNATACKVGLVKKEDIKDDNAIPTLRDILPDGVGSKVFDTTNQFEQELLSGVKFLHPSTPSGCITMESKRKYRKVLRKDYPDEADTWFHPDKPEPEDYASALKTKKASRRWKDLPQPYDDSFVVEKLVAPGSTAQPKMETRYTSYEATQNTVLAQILREWQSKWNLTGRFEDATFVDIIRDMTDIQPHVRLQAIATVGRAVDYHQCADKRMKALSNVAIKKYPIVPDEVFTALQCLLDDSHAQVRRAAAITLFALEKPSKKAQDILQLSLQSESSVERWAAVQCLAHFGACDSKVVQEILHQILASENPIKHQQGTALLVKVSHNTTLVHGIVAEQLNSSSWRHKVIACRILPALSGNINKDVTHKLTDMMWNDWHGEVRKAAAQCLGKTSHGREVHDDIYYCLRYGGEKTRLEAISRLGQFGIMTAKLLPAFLSCFDDQYNCIRSECCITAGNLRIREPMVLSKLIYLATFDLMWKVKALAIQALGKIGEVTGPIKACLLWAMRFEEKAGVRAEACHTLVKMSALDDTTIHIIQERLLVETSQVVREEMVEALRVVGVSATEDIDTVAQIKDDLRKLCTRNNISSQIVLNEADQIHKEILFSMFDSTAEEMEIQTHGGLISSHQKVVVPSSSSSLNRKSEFSLFSSPSPYALSPDGLSRDGLSRDGTFLSALADQEVERMQGMSRESSYKSAPSNQLSSPRSLSPRSSRLTLSQTHLPETPLVPEPKKRPERVSDKRDSQVPVPLDFVPAKPILGLVASASLSDLELKQSASFSSDDRISFPLMQSESVIMRRQFSDQITSRYANLSARYTHMDEELNRMDGGFSTTDNLPEDSMVGRLPGIRVASAVYFTDSNDNAAVDSPRPSSSQAEVSGSREWKGDGDADTSSPEQAQASSSMVESSKEPCGNECLPGVGSQLPADTAHAESEGDGQMQGGDPGHTEDTVAIDTNAQEAGDRKHSSSIQDHTEDQACTEDTGKHSVASSLAERDSHANFLTEGRTEIEEQHSTPVVTERDRH